MIKDAVQSGKATLIDVRETYEFESGHVEGAINIPLSELPGKLDAIRQLTMPLYVHCRSGMRSANAAAFLQQNGIAEVTNVGGLEDAFQAMQ